MNITNIHNIGRLGSENMNIVKYKWGSCPQPGIFNWVWAFQPRREQGEVTFFRKKCSSFLWIRFNIAWGEVVTFIHGVKLYSNKSFILVCCKYMIKTPRLRGFFFLWRPITNVDNVSKSVNVTVWSIVSISVLWRLWLIWFYNLFFFLIWLHWVLVAACELLVAAYGIKFPDQGSNPGPMHWECRVLASRLLGKSLTLYSLTWSVCVSHWW